MPAAKRRPRVNLPYLIRDRAYMRDDPTDNVVRIVLATPLQTFSAVDDGGFLDGPANDVVAVLDFDLESGKASEKRKFVPQGIGKSVSCYDIGYSDLGPDSEPESFETTEFMQVSTFATVLKVLEFFESSDNLGRKVRWAFGADKLKIIPRAGEGRNAFYDRANHNIQFYFHRASQGHTIYTALSHDIVVHETTHAVLDGVAPDLYDAILPQSLALHEAMADITAITQTLLNEMVLFSYDALTGGTDKDEYSALSNIAEEFGADIRRSEGKNYLRRMKNFFCMRQNRMPDPSAAVVVPADEPHQLSQVLSGVLYAVMERRMSETHRPAADIFATLETTFVPAARRVARIIVRALDYLPPGEASFIDYGRAFVLAARTTYKRPQKEVRWLKQEFVERGIVEDGDELEPTCNMEKISVNGALAEKIVANDRAARKFVQMHRDHFGLPEEVEFELLPRTIAQKAIGRRKQRELFVKLHWRDVEQHDVAPGLGREWAVRKGVTIAVDLDSMHINVLHTVTNATLVQQRGMMLKKLHGGGRLSLTAEEKESQATQGQVVVKDADGVMELRGAMRLLHIIAD